MKPPPHPIPWNTHTHPWPPPFPPLYQLKGIWLLPSDSPRLKVPFTLPQFTKRSDYGKQKYCVRAHFFVPELRDVRDTRIAGERESLIKLHLVKQTSLHSSCQRGRIYVVVNREWYLKELTETNLRHGRPYIIHSTPHPCPQLGFPDALQIAVVSSQQLWGFSLKVKWWQIQEWQERLVWASHHCEKINHRMASRRCKKFHSECNMMRQCFSHKYLSPLGYLVRAALFVLHW